MLTAAGRRYRKISEKFPAALQSAAGDYAKIWRRRVMAEYE
ncbi:hypothetical protein BRYFOR_09537 [Marvinbryantia formatexigens DSM 14469]|uniref:Uncharacterized protein n=1 Tax=Marvinbryantia formatexigens DSM 14469 TaxID=478749 RepID=C6LLI9_9FIRM|nr:hypothetical protein [Marvinbryantia formatexigens]EET58529.1 hypothetical protein BRYFOR_09537 [Marvinbryantia formatexigens DSM 14469]